MIEAIVAGLKIILKILEAFVMVLPKLLELIDYIKEIRKMQLQRLKDAIAKELELKQKAVENQAILEAANIAAWNHIVEDIWKITYQQILSLLNEKKYDEVLIFTKFIDFKGANDLLFNSAYSNEFKAMQLADIMRNTTRETYYGRSL